MRRYSERAIGILTLAAVLSTGGLVRAQDAGTSEADCLAVLASDASRQDKAAACRQLVRVGTAAAIQPLAALLADPALSHMARYALEPRPESAVDDAFRHALGALEGLPLVGVIGSVGVRRDAQAVPLLVPMLNSADTQVARAAARALGSIGTSGAADALAAVLAGKEGAERDAVCEGLLRAAEHLGAADSAKAIALYDRLSVLEGVPHSVRTAGFRGGALLRGEAGIPQLLAGLRGENYVRAMAAARTGLDMPAAVVVRPLSAALASLSAERQILATFVLGKHGDDAAAPALSALARKGDPAARLAAIRALPEIGDASVARVLIDLQGDPDEQVATAARAALAGLPGGQVDAALLAMLRQGDSEARAQAVELLGSRRVSRAVPALFRAARDADGAVRLASLGALGGLVHADRVPDLVALLVEAGDGDQRRAAEKALAAVCERLAQPDPGKVVIHSALYGDLPDGKKKDVTKIVTRMVRQGAVSITASNGNFGDPVHGIRKRMTIRYTADGTLHTTTVEENGVVVITAGAAPPAVVDAICAALPEASTEAKPALLRTLRAARGPKALAALRAAASEAGSESAGAAVSMLATWPTVDALPILTEMASKTKDRRTKILALRGWFRLVPLQSVGEAEKLASLKQALALADRAEEERLGLASLASLPLPEALETVLPYLQDAGLTEEAALAAVAIGEALRGPGRANILKPAMAQVLAASKSDATRTRAQALLE